MRPALVVSLTALLAVTFAPLARAASDAHDFADDYVEFLAMYAEAGSDEEVNAMLAQLQVMTSENEWLQQATTTLESAVSALEQDPKASAAAMLQSVLYVTKGLSDPDAAGQGSAHRLTKEERVALLDRLRVLREAEWVRANETVMTTSGLFADFLKGDAAS